MSTQDHPRPMPEPIVVRLDNPAPWNDPRTEADREAFYQSVIRHDEPMVALDLSALDYLSSSGVAILIGLKRRVDAVRGRLVLFRLQPFLLDLLRGMKLTSYFQIAESEQEAREMLRPLGTV